MKFRITTNKGIIRVDKKDIVDWYGTMSTNPIISAFEDIYINKNKKYNNKCLLLDSRVRWILSKTRLSGGATVQILFAIDKEVKK